MIQPPGPFTRLLAGITDAPYAQTDRPQPGKMEVISDKWSFVVDLREKFGGEGSGPNHSELTAAAVASCEVLTGVVWAARRHRIELRGVEAEVTWEYGEKPERISKIDVIIRNVSSQLGDKTENFAAIAKGCTVSQTFKIQPELCLKKVLFRIRRNLAADKQIKPQRQLDLLSAS